MNKLKCAWRAAPIGIDRLAFNIVGAPSVKVAGDRAEIRFELTAEGTLDGGVPIKPARRA